MRERPLGLPLLVALLSTTSASGTMSPELAIRQRNQGAKRQFPFAFQITKPVFELEPEAYNEGKPYLIQFKGKGDDYCAQMEPLKEQLKEELGLEIRCFEVWYDTKNLELLQRLDRGRCGGVPFFYNKRSRRYVCGATTYANLKAWALCEPCEPFCPPPNINQDNEEPNKVQKVFGRLRALADEKLGRTSDDDDGDDNDDGNDEQD
eukprot:CAMPEP_0115849080 /NCGR_PEP_ID=MMETSP0287-20121206/11263_1 /TAXON_ID=412157 /ORGANISM="Chrysochromulina rotalis, Strain UIO044" /LENGTH=205 /DNA_ID=CAMNT_0003303033 /DNA_START=15 /DNA_END=632 /DNA_ORIENTATION=+